MDEQKLQRILECCTTKESVLYLISFTYIFGDKGEFKDEEEDFMDKVNPEMLEAIEDLLPEITKDNKSTALYILVIRGALDL